MALTINEKCSACNACLSACPNDAIRAAAPIFVIDPSRCTECVGAEDEPQCKLVCPVECIVPHAQFRESTEQLQAKFERLHA